MRMVASATYGVGNNEQLFCGYGVGNEQIVALGVCGGGNVAMMVLGEAKRCCTRGNSGSGNIYVENNWIWL